MSEESVSLKELFGACCNPRVVRRQYAREVLFKRLTIAELERRHQLYASELSHNEEEAFQKVLAKFKKGWYTGIEVKRWVSTFYTP